MADIDYCQQHAAAYARDVAGASDEQAEAYGLYYRSLVEADPDFFPSHRDIYWLWATK